MNQVEWLEYGIRNGFCGPQVCVTHDGFPTTSEEDDEMVELDDPCLFLIRLYRDEQHRAAVEANHSPSIWRK